MYMYILRIQAMAYCIRQAEYTYSIKGIGGFRIKGAGGFSPIKGAVVQIVYTFSCFLRDATIFDLPVYIHVHCISSYIYKYKQFQ